MGSPRPGCAMTALMMAMLVAAAAAEINGTFKLAEYYNGSKPGLGCAREPVCTYKGTAGRCVD